MPAPRRRAFAASLAHLTAAGAAPAAVKASPVMSAAPYRRRAARERQHAATRIQLPAVALSAPSEWPADPAGGGTPSCFACCGGALFAVPVVFGADEQCARAFCY